MSEEGRHARSTGIDAETGAAGAHRHPFAAGAHHHALPLHAQRPHLGSASALHSLSHHRHRLRLRQLLLRHLRLHPLLQLRASPRRREPARLLGGARQPPVPRLSADDARLHSDAGSRVARAFARAVRRRRHHDTAAHPGLLPASRHLLEHGELDALLRGRSLSALPVAREVQVSRRTSASSS